jgi:lysozyme
MAGVPSRAFLRASLRLWRRRERYRKHRHDHWQRLLDAARRNGEHPRQKLVDKRDHWSKLLAQARAKVRLREHQLGQNGAVKGIDVSNNNGHVDWRKVYAAGYRFAWCKASEGLTFTDSTFLANVKAAQAAGLQVGAYHFLTGGPVASQAAHFAQLVRAAGLGRGHLLPVVDAEKAGVTTTQVKEFVDGVHNLLGVRPVIYTFPAFAQWPSTFGCKLWIANFGVAKPTIPAPWKAYAAWQYSSTARVPGVNGNCDVNKAPSFEELIW